jgi:hypothetical protein
MARREFLGSIADNCEDVLREAVGGLKELFIKALFLVFLVDRHVDQRGDHGLGIPVGETSHDEGEFLVRVNRALTCVFIFQWCIGINGRFCGGCELLYARGVGEY